MANKTEEELKIISVKLLEYFGTENALEQYWMNHGQKDISKLAFDMFGISYHHFKKICLDIFNFKKRDKNTIRRLKQNTWLTREPYSEEQKAEALKKREETCLVKYGCVNVFQNEDIKKQIRKTCLSKYGVENINSLESNKIQKSISASLRSEEEKLKIVETRETTCFQKYGVKNTFLLVDNIKQTKLERYGDENYNNRAKASETCQARFGAASFSQTILAQRTPKFKVYIADNIWFDSFPELAIYLYYKAHKLPIERASLRFEYVFNNESHYYFPDFIIDGQIIEVKGDHLFRRMQQKDTIDNAKYQCMLQNGVIIWTSSMYNKYVKWFKTTGLKKEDFKRRGSSLC